MTLPQLQTVGGVLKIRSNDSRIDASCASLLGLSSGVIRGGVDCSRVAISSSTTTSTSSASATLAGVSSGFTTTATSITSNVATGTTIAGLSTTTTSTALSSTTSASVSPSAENAANQHSHTGAIAGGIVGGIVGLALLTYLPCMICRRRWSTGRNDNMATKIGHIPPQEMADNQLVPELRSPVAELRSPGALPAELQSPR